MNLRGFKEYKYRSSGYVDFWYRSNLKEIARCCKAQPVWEDRNVLSDRVVWHYGLSYYACKDLEREVRKSQTAYSSQRELFSSGSRADFSVREHTAFNRTASSEMIAPAVQVNRLSAVSKSSAMHAVRHQAARNSMHVPATCFYRGSLSCPGNPSFLPLTTIGRTWTLRLNSLEKDKPADLSVAL